MTIHGNFTNSICHDTAKMVADSQITLSLTLMNDVHFPPSPRAPTARCDIIGVKFLRLACKWFILCSSQDPHGNIISGEHYSPLLHILKTISLLPQMATLLLADCFQCPTAAHKTARVKLSASFYNRQGQRACLEEGVGVRMQLTDPTCVDHRQVRTSLIWQLLAVGPKR